MTEKALLLHKQCQKLPTNSVIRDQLLSASLSIVLNTAEATGKSGLKDRKRFFSIALGSLRETQALLDVLEVRTLDIVADEIGAML